MTAAGRRRAGLVALALLVAAGFALRLEHGRRGLPYLLHWDEPFLVHRAIVMAETGDPNPRFFNYGTLRIYLDLPAVAFERWRLGRLPADDPARLSPARPLRFRGAPEDSLRRGAAGLPPWWISHPSLYRAARAMSALHGTIAIGLAAALASRLAHGRLAGLGAAALLAFDPASIALSSVATVDVLAATAVLAVLVATQRFVDLERPRDLALAFLAVGLAASAKYNMAVVAVAPAAALGGLLRRAADRRRWAKWLGLGPLLALAAFVSTSPYVVLDVPRAFADAERMARTYLAGESSKAAIPAGPRHLVADLVEIGRRLGPAVSILAVAGLAVLARRRRGGAVLGGALALLLLQAATSVDYHRNLLALYGLAAAAGGVALAAAASAAAPLLERRAGLGGRSRWAAALGPALLAALALPLAARALERVRTGTRPPPRTQALAELARRPELARGGIAVASELGLHPLDRARLPERLVERPLVELACDPRGFSVALVPRRIGPARSAAGEDRTARWNQALALLGESVWESGPEPFALDRPSAFAGVALRRPARADPDSPLCAAARPPGRGGRRGAAVR